jgi:hypothetical protein
MYNVYMIKIILASISAVLLISGAVYVNINIFNNNPEKEASTELSSESLSATTVSENIVSSEQNQKQLSLDVPSVDPDVTTEKSPTTKETNTTPPKPPVTQPQESPSIETVPLEVKNVDKKGACVYNHAYQENYENDSISKIINDAEDCYVLIDPYEDKAYKQITTLQAKGNTVGCYISVGTGEDWRTDFEALKPYLAKKAWGQWAGEYFVRTTITGIIPLMEKRIDTLAKWGCDYVEFDNMDWAFDDDNRDEYNLEVTKAESKKYNQTLCTYVHKKGMKCMAKNTRNGAEMFDGGTYESYSDEKNWWNTAGLKSFLQEGKFGIIVHYDEKNCDNIHQQYKYIYGETVSFICEDTKSKEYVHYSN